ncbi:MAG TPA: glycosyltransferase family 4 protein [Candidatus Brocadiia bacterium]|nr:glycosyltransferase family 4 protein [Candidatus Brocadiia bacterium]
MAINVKYFSPRGGAQTYIAYLAGCLLDAGHEVDVFAMERDPAFRCSAFHKVAASAFPKLLRDYSFAAASAKALKDSDYDVIFADQKAFFVDVVRLGGGVWRQYMERELQSLKGYPLSFLSAAKRRLSVKERLNLEIERRLYACPRLKRVIVNSACTKEALLKDYDLPPDNIRVVYNGVNLARYNPARRMELRGEARRALGLAEDDYVLLLLAMNFRLKGLLPLLEAVAKVRGEIAPRKVRLLAVGKKRAGFHAARARSLGLADSVQFLGPTKKPEECLAAADVLAHPTYHDPCANVCLEAMACGMPVVTTRANGASELIADGDSGYVIVHASEISALADRLAKLSDDGLRLRMGEAARRGVERLTPERNMKQVIEIFQEIVGG